MTDTTPITFAQRAVLRALIAYVEAHEYPPTVRELATACGYASPSHSHAALDALVYRGYVQRTPGIARGLRVTDEGREAAGR